MVVGKESARSALPDSVLTGCSGRLKLTSRSYRKFMKRSGDEAKRVELEAKVKVNEGNAQAARAMQIGDARQRA